MERERKIVRRRDKNTNFAFAVTFLARVRITVKNKRMKGWIWALWLSSLVMTGLAQEKKVINDPNAESREVDDFHSVEVSGAIELIITQAPEMAVAISADNRDDVAKIVAETRDGVLYIGYKDGRNWWQNQWNTMGRKFRAYVSAPEFRSVSSAGSGSIRIQGLLKAGEITFMQAGSGNIEGRLEADALEVVQSGSGNVRLSGKIVNADVRCSGSGNFRSEGLSVDVYAISMSGSGNADITVNKELSARVSGSGSVRYRGEGLVKDMQISGSGKIRRVDGTSGVSLGRNIHISIT